MKNEQFLTQTHFGFLLCGVIKGEPPQFVIKHIYVLLFSWKGSNLCSMWERQTETREAAILTHDLNIACYVIFKTPLRTSSSWLEYSAGGCCEPLPTRRTLSVTASWLSIRPSLTPSDERPPVYIIFEHPQLLINQMTTYAYLHRFVSDWRLSQGSICNIGWENIPFFKNAFSFNSFNFP